MADTKHNEILKKIYAAREQYDTNLKNKSLLIIYRINNNKYDYIIISFKSSNFMHLTGCKYLKGTASQFYKALKKNEVSVDDISFINDSTCEMKSQIISNIACLHKITKMIGDFNGTKRIFQYNQSGKITGNAYSALALLKVNNFYVPVSALKENTKDLVIKPYKVIATYRKNSKAKKFNELCYKAKDVNLDSVQFSEHIKNKIDDKINIL